MTDKPAAGLNEVFTRGSNTDVTAQCRSVGM